MNKIKPIMLELIATALLALAIVGSGYMASELTKDSALILFINALATAIGLAIAINLAGKISGAHLNPVVTLVMLIQKRVSSIVGIFYIISQICGAILGTITANYIFGQGAFQSSTQIRSGSNLLVSEVIATAGLLWIILNNLSNSKNIERYVPLWIFGGIIFTSSTSFANPAITIGRSFTDSVTGIAPSSILGFVVAQIVGGFIGLILAKNFKNE
jgi:glycerol uptake facilitator-like aquaporin